MAIHKPSDLLDVTVSIVPQVVTDTPTTGTLFRDVRGFRKTLVVCAVGAMASGSATVKPYQATAADGTGAKAIGTRSATLDAAGEVATFDVDPTELDAENGFYFVGAWIDPPNVATGLTAFVVGVEPLHAPTDNPNVAVEG
jgi:hypothetical protein